MDINFIIAMVVSVLLIIAFLFYGLQLMDCSKQVNAKVVECEERCMCPWELNAPFDGDYSDIFEDFGG